MKTNFLHAYKQAPWRTQLQWIGIFLLILVTIAAIAGVYLSVSERAATTGRQIQNLEEEITLLEIENNDLASQLASIKSIKNMQARVEELDMVRVDPQQALYLEIPGYVPKEAAVLAPPARSDTRETPVLLPEFTASLWDWFLSKLSQPQIPSECSHERSGFVAVYHRRCHRFFSGQRDWHSDDPHPKYSRRS